MGVAGVGHGGSAGKETPFVNQFVATVLLWLLAPIALMGASFSDDFATAPTRWREHNPGSVRWDETNANLAVTWDSRGTNSFFYFPLGTTLTRADSFSFEFTLRIDDLMLGIDPAKRYTFQLAAGFLNLAQAKRPEFFRAAGVNAAHGPRSMVEFCYFPESGIIDPTIGPIIASTNNQIAFSHTHPVELEMGATYRVKMSFDAATQTLTTEMEHNGEPFGQAPNNTIQPLVYGANFGDFRIDAFSIHSYSDAGQTSPQFAGSLLAHGVIDDVKLTWPAPPEIKIAGRFEEGAWVVSFEPTASWSYSLERSIDFEFWDEVDSGPGPDLRDSDPPDTGAFYRVVASRL